jgi:uncharacterized protein (DUF58 family)
MGWDADVLSRIQALELHARALVDGFLHGSHASHQVTSNVEFADYKEYAPGDPLRDLDWRVLGRTDRLVVRRHRAEHELTTTLVVDASGDLATGASGGWPTVEGSPFQGSKWGYAAVLTATLAYWLLRQGEPVGLQVLGGDKVRWRFLPPRAGDGQLVRILGVLASLEPAGEARLAEGLLEVGQRLHQRQLVVLVSDLMEEPGEWGPALRALLERRADVRVVHLHDQDELSMNLPEAGLFVSPEGGEVLPEDPLEIRAAFVEEVARYRADVARWLSSARGVLLPAPTNAPMDLLLVRLLRGLP